MGFSYAGVIRPIVVAAAKAGLVNTQWLAAVTAANVETSSHITGVVLGTLVQAMPEGTNG